MSAADVVVALAAAIVLVGVALAASAIAVTFMDVAETSNDIPDHPAGGGNTPRERAEDLLRDVLDEHEYAQLRKRGYLDVASPGHPQRVYRIPRAPDRVCVFEGGRARWELCIQPIEPIPSADIVAMHKLMIQGNEEEYLARANRFPSFVPRGSTLP
jgi:hypothetical protein